MKEILEIKHLLSNQHLKVANLLSEPLNDYEIVDLMNQVNLVASKDIIQIYTSINGTQISSQQLGLQWFYPGFLFLSLEGAIELYKEECLQYESWDKEYFPIFWNGNRDYLLVNLMERISPVYLFSMEPDAFSYANLITIYDSVELLFKSVLACFEQKCYLLSNNVSEIKTDHVKEVEISRRLNPKSEYWKLFSTEDS